MNTHFIGENIIPGYLGKVLILSAFVFSLLSLLAYFIIVIRGNNKAAKLENKADLSFVVHSIGLFISSFILLYMLLNRLYEYKYVWVHTENSLGFEYLIAAFWAGQEGSLLLWASLQAAIGLIIIRHEKKFKIPLMLVVSLSQVFMASLMLGISFGSFQIGMSPFLLLREASENIGNQFFADPNYLQYITDGNGLNPLLRNFWMLSHPPVLFVGYALALVPFAYAISGLITGQYHQWIKPALPWIIAAIFFLGAGIILGGVWAYESLTFGGFWAWDPVENASLVPWLLLIAALHLMLLVKKMKNTFLMLFVFTLLSFVFVIYSTFLTRSGVLAETSVHSFGNDGMGWHLLIYIIALLALGSTLLFRNIKNFPTDKTTELLSREFWIFIAVMAIFLASFQIIFTTSLPVINKLFNTNYAPPADIVGYYNKWQAPFALIIAMILGVSNYLVWGKNEIRKLFALSWFSLLLSIITFSITIIFFNIHGIILQLLLFSAYYGFFSSLDSILRLKEKIISKEASICHMGFALFLAALVLTFSKQEVISKNTSGYYIGDNFSEQENLLLVKGKILPMGDYHVLYSDVEYTEERIIFSIDFLKKNKQGQFYKAFESNPSILLNEKMGNVFEPYSNIFLFKNIFTYISYADIENHTLKEQYSLLGDAMIKLNDSIYVNNDMLVFNDLTFEHTGDKPDLNNIIITAHLHYITHYGNVYIITPEYEIKNGKEFHHDDYIEGLSLLFRFSEVSDIAYIIKIEIFQEKEDIIVIKTIVFPFINLLWLSLIIILAGIFLSFRKRRKGIKNI